MELKAAKLELQKEGTFFTPYELGDSPFGKQNHLKPATYKKRMGCIERVRLMSPELPCALQGPSWTRRQMAFCKRCPNGRGLRQAPSSKTSSTWLSLRWAIATEGAPGLLKHALPRIQRSSRCTRRSSTIAMPSQNTCSRCRSGSHLL